MERERPNIKTTRELVERLKEAKVINLDVPLGEVLSAAAEQTGMEEVAGYVFCWENYCLVVKSIEERVKPQ